MILWRFLYGSYYGSMMIWVRHLHPRGAPYAGGEVRHLHQGVRHLHHPVRGLHPMRHLQGVRYLRGMRQIHPVRHLHPWHERALLEPPRG
jgi:hypothetical protein